MHQSNNEDNKGDTNGVVAKYFITLQVSKAFPHGASVSAASHSGHHPFKIQEMPGN